MDQFLRTKIPCCLGNSLKTSWKNVSNKRTFSLSLFESESHYTVIVTHFFRPLNLFEIFKGKYCEVLKFYFCIRNDSYLLIFEFYIGLMLQCNLTYFLFYSIKLVLGSVHILRHPILALFRPPPPSVIHRHLWQTPPLDDVIFSHPPPLHEKKYEIFWFCQFSKTVIMTTAFWFIELNNKI